MGLGACWDLRRPRVSGDQETWKWGPGDGRAAVSLNKIKVLSCILPSNQLINIDIFKHFTTRHEKSSRGFHWRVECGAEAASCLSGSSEDWGGRPRRPPRPPTLAQSLSLGHPGPCRSRLPPPEEQSAHALETCSQLTPVVTAATRERPGGRRQWVDQREVMVVA